jgi:flagellar basal-body rod protein FlgB
VSEVNATKALLKVALDASVMRHQAIANNLANLHSVGYAPLHVNFDEQLGALRSALASGGEVTSTQVAALQPHLVQDEQLASGLTTSMIDSEMLKLQQNTVYYQSLLKALQKRGAITSLAVNEGRP